jgi:predicted AAA+ superfamily ATPase
MVGRNIAPTVLRAATHYPVVTITGPRQSGKTTLCRASFPQLPYVSLEPLDRRESARRDPRSFLAGLERGAVLDEIQHVPELLSYLQEVVDEDPTPGRWILTGSQHLALNAAVSQSLAGRTAVLQLLPLSLDEIRRFDLPAAGLWETLWRGGYPRPWDRGIPVDRWLGDYVSTYVERDVRQVLDVGDLSAFATFLRLCAGRTATELNLSDLGRDAGVSHNTARSWLSVLETGWILARLPSWHRNVAKQQIKAHKLVFLDSGLACWLLGVRDPGQLAVHPLRGAVFESWVASEILKWRFARGLPAALLHYRETRGVALDLLVDGSPRIAVEAKSGATLAGDWLDHLVRWDDGRRVLVHGGEAQGHERDVELVPWHTVPSVDWGG